jgi:hypothetical protein
LIRASAMKESIRPWSEIGLARVVPPATGEGSSKLAIEDPAGRIRVAYGSALINRPLEEAAELINLHRSANQS